MRSDIKIAFSEPYLTLVHPVLATPVKEVRQQNDPNVLVEQWAIRPWVGMSNSEDFVIGSEIILTMGDLKDGARRQYEEYLIKVKMFEETQRIVEEDAHREAEIYKLLRSVSNTGEVKFIDEGGL